MSELEESFEPNDFYTQIHESPESFYLDTNIKKLKEIIKGKIHIKSKDTKLVIFNKILIYYELPELTDDKIKFAKTKIAIVKKINKQLKSLTTLIETNKGRIDGKKESIRKKAIGRHSDSHYYITKYMVCILVNNPFFTAEDLKTKLEIFGIDDEYTCFVSKEKQKAKGGDHLWEINGYNVATDYRGVDDEWNIIPVSSKLNTSYKIFDFTMNNKKIKKNIGYETLTDDEYNYLRHSNNTTHRKYVDIYDKITRWKRYVISRNAVICLKNPANYTKILETFTKRYHHNMRATLESIDDMLKNITVENRFSNIYKAVITKSTMIFIKKIKVYRENILLQNSRYTV